SITTETGETFYIYAYDSNFTLISRVVDPDKTLPAGTAWVKFVLYGSSDFAITRSLTISIKKADEIRYAKNSYAAVSQMRFCFETKRPYIPQSNGENTYAGNTDRIWDTGRIYLPYNYSRDGKPSPLVIFCHGTGGYTFGGSESAYAAYLQFIAKNGYAVVDCSGITSYYGTDLYNAQVTDLNDSKSSPLLYSCMASMYDWVTRNFNVEKEVYLLSKSAGGLASMYLSYYAPFKVKAVAAFSPALLMAGQSFRVTGKIPLDFWLEQLGYVSPDVTYPINSTDMAYILANYTNLLGYDSFFTGTDMDYESVLSLMYSIEPSATGSTISQKLANAYAANDQLMAAFDSAKKFLPVPLKMWIAQDDETVPYMWAQKLVGMVQRANGHCALRTMPNGTGGHHSTDTSPNAITVSILCPNGETVTVPAAYAEAVDWFKQW
ncbi:MAG: alpha/beta hydrolase, partial [Bacteroidales bacterium]|nr:alpha/beta hydrolase [Bacteroidales bacterium]